ncbi:CHRD domain-containing protein [Janthinobacterium agaricidamnosum]|nr:CHRD domain-containing protein [Janthinobacterium agaricidamnosum]
MMRSIRLASLAAITGALLFGAACSNHHHADGVILSGAQEAPPNDSRATGNSMIKIGSDKSVYGEVRFSGMVASVAHIHQAPAGVAGPVIVPLIRISDTAFAVPPGITLNDAQYAAYLAGKLYVNLHSTAFPNGEIRAQLHPR